MQREGCLVSDRPSIMQMDRRNFSYKREMRLLFAETASRHGHNINVNADLGEE